MFTAPVFRSFSEGPDPRLRALIDGALEWARGRAAPLRVVAPPWIEVSWRRSAEGEIIHLVNHARGSEARPRSPVVEYVPLANQVRVERELPRPPRAVRLVPSDAGEIHSEWADGLLRVTLPAVAVHAALLLEWSEPESQP